MNVLKRVFVKKCGHKGTLLSFLLFLCEKCAKISLLLLNRVEYVLFSTIRTKKGFIIMIIDFSVKNFLSFKEKQTLSFVASNYDKSHPENYIEPNLPGMKGIKLLKGLAIYGANASGKTNILNALDYLRELVKDSFAEGAKQDHVLYKPFMLDETSRNEPTELEMRFVCEGCRYDYSVILMGERIILEELSAFPNGSRQEWISRKWDDQQKTYQWKSRYPALLQVKDRIKPNVLALSAANAFNCDPLDSIYKWFVQNMQTDFSSKIRTHSYTGTVLMRGNEDDRLAILEMLRCADLGINDATIKRELVDSENLEDALSKGASIISYSEGPLLSYVPQYQTMEVNFQHQGQYRKDYELPWKDESQGTRNLFNLVGPLLYTLFLGKICAIDEVDASLHPLMTIELLKKFFSEDNDRAAQIVFTTHNPLILDAGILRRDQVYFVEKDHEGSSSIVALLEYKPRKGESLAYGYLAGRYGAIPKIDC